MRRLVVTCVATLLTLLVANVHVALSQSPRGKDLDKQHEEIIRDFLARTHKLVLQYQQAGSYDKARESLELILKVAPEDAQAKGMLEKISKQELTENKKVVKVLANQGWQKTDVYLIAGKPVSIEAKGDWLFKISRTVGADGVEMPDDLKQFPLGALIGAIDAEPTPKREGKKEKDANRPFLIGAQKVFDAPANGMLYLKMHDSDELDNQGSLTVTISGQFRER